MIIVKLFGGLGNQLFQYAAGRSLAAHHNISLKLDVRDIASNRVRPYSLSPFKIVEDFASEEEIARIKGTDRSFLSRWCFSLAEKMKPYYSRSVFREPYLKPFDANVFKTPTAVYLDGYWQSERYFINIQDIIRREFTIKFEPNYENIKLAENICSTDSVSIHIRRGDYISKPETYRVHGTCELDYYARCMEIISKAVSKPHFFVFSDDYLWSTNNLKLIDRNVTHITHNIGTDFEDLRLMSMCKHNIIANSSFSWWGAWLNSNPKKVVLAPKRWFNEATYDTRDLVPASWTKVQNDVHPYGEVVTVG
jgi:hypothetical protein